MNWGLESRMALSHFPSETKQIYGSKLEIYMFDDTYKTCAHMYITSKRIELESPSCSGIEENLKSFKT